MTLALRLVCAVTPWAVAGLRFGRGPARAFGVIQRPLDQFAEPELRELFADPRIDVSIGLEAPTGDWCFVPAADILDLARLRQQLSPPAEQSPPRDTLAVIAEHQRLELERGRDAALPGGDDEGAGDQAETNTTTAVDGADAQVPSEGTTAQSETAAQETTAAPAPGTGDGEVAREQATGDPGESNQPAAEPAPAPVVPPAAEPISTSIAPPPPKGPPRARRQPAQK